MAAAPLANLSLLSRGIGEVQHGGHEKIEVKLEPEDYNNWLEDSRRVWNLPALLPPIKSSLQPTFHNDAATDNGTESLPSHRSKLVPATHDVKYSKVYLPKTFTTRKGALLLFSEDFASRRLSEENRDLAESQKRVPSPELRTVDDLARSILAYGASKSFSYSGEHTIPSDEVYLGFGKSRTNKYYERQYKPGFSAKRYLSSWTKLWDHHLLNKVTSKGYIKPVPFQKKSDYDVSGIPLPYRILRQWLFAPGTIDGYTFYRQNKYEQVPSREPTIIVVEETPRPISVETEISAGSIQVSSLIANKDMNYKELDNSTKESILTELLVKSAITHAIKKQKEYQETVSKNLDDEEAKREASAKLYEFDMMNAIQSALDNSVLPTVTYSNIESQEIIPTEHPKKSLYQGFRGVKGIGLRVSPTSSSAEFPLTIKSPFEDRHRVLPPIRQEKDRLSGWTSIGDEIPEIPTATYPSYTQMHKPVSLLDGDEEYASWRKSVLSSRNNVAMVAEEASKPPKSLSKFNMDNVDSVDADTAAAVTVLATDGGSTNSSVLGLVDANAAAASNTPNTRHSAASSEKLVVEKPLIQQNTETNSLVGVQGNAAADAMTPAATVSHQPAANGPMATLGAPVATTHKGEHFSSALDSLGSPSSIHTSKSRTKVKRSKQLPSNNTNIQSTSPNLAKSRDKVISDEGRNVKNFTTDVSSRRQSDVSQPDISIAALADSADVLDFVKPQSIVSKDSQSIVGEDSQSIIGEDQVRASLLAVPNNAAQNSSAESKTPASLFSSALILDTSIGSYSTEEVKPTTETKVNSVDLFNQVGLDAEDDKKSVISTMSMLSLTSKRSRFSGSSVDAPYTKGITARQDPNSGLLKVDLVADENDPTNAITSWKYNVQQVELYADKVKIEELVEPVESVVEASPSPPPPDVDSSASELEPSLAEESLAEVEKEDPVVIEIPTPPISVPSAEECLTPPSPAAITPPSPATLTTVESPVKVSEQEFMEVLTEQAREIAKAILDGGSEAGEDLALDAKAAAEMLMSNLPDASSGTQSARTQSKTGDGENEGTLTADDGSEVHVEGATLGQLVKEGLEDFDIVSNSVQSIAPSVPSAHHDTPSPAVAASAADDSLSKSALSSATTKLKSANTINRELESAMAAAAAAAPVADEADRVPSESSKKASTTPPKKSAGKVQHESEFVVGKVADKTELQQLYAPIESDSSPSKAKAKQGKSKSIVPKPAPKKEAPKKVEKPPAKKPIKKAAKKKPAKAGKAAAESATETEASVRESPVVVPPKEPTPPPEPEPEPEPEEWKTPEPEEEPDIEFVIVRDEFSDEEDKEEEKPQLGSVKSLNFGSSSPGPSITDSSNLDEEKFKAAESIPGLSNRDAQAAKRAAAKERRRKEVERRRREREEAIKKEKEDAERKERIRLQMEEERARREEEIRLKKEREKEEKERLEREEEMKLKAQKDAQERERRRQEEMAKYLEEKRQRAMEEERRRKELQALKDAEEAERLRLEQEMLQAMAEEERAEFLRRKAEEERLQKIAEEEARIKREAEAKRLWEALQLQEAEKRKAEELLRQRLLFQRSLNVESHGMDHSQDITRAFVFSYYELLKWLGYEIPAWAQYGPTLPSNYNVTNPDFTNQSVHQPKH